MRSLDPGVARLKRPILKPSILDTKVGFYTDDGFLAASSRCTGRQGGKAHGRAGATVIPSSSNSKRTHHFYYSALSSDGGATIRGRLKGVRLSQLKMLMRSAKMPSALRRSIAGPLKERRTSHRTGAESRRRQGCCHVLETNAARSSMRLDALTWDSAHLDIVLCPSHATPPLRHGDSADFSAAGSIPCVTIF